MSQNNDCIVASVAALTGGDRQLGSNTLSVTEPGAVYGFRPFPKSGTLVTNELINQLKDQEGL
jgi:hypothetical protein